MTTTPLRLDGPDVARIHAERRELYDALADVIRYDDLHHPCGHAPSDPDHCTHCHARALVAKHRGLV